MAFESPFRARIVCRDIGGGRAQLVATIDDGREFSDASAFALAKKLRQAGIFASEVCMPDWREGDLAPSASQKIRVFHCLRLWERGEEPVDDDTLYGPDNDS